MSFLERLPPEVVLIILEDVEMRPEIARLARTSRTLYAQLNPQLWRIVILKTREAVESFMRALLPTMLSRFWPWFPCRNAHRAELANLVQYLALPYLDKGATHMAVPLLQACPKLQSLQLDTNYQLHILNAHIKRIPKLFLSFRAYPIIHPLVPPLHCTHLHIKYMNYTTIENLPQLRVLSFDIGDYVLEQIHPDPKLAQLLAQIREALAIPTLERVVIRIVDPWSSESVAFNAWRSQHNRPTAASALYKDLHYLHDKRILFTILKSATIKNQWLQYALGSDKVFRGNKFITDDPISHFGPEE